MAFEHDTECKNDNEYTPLFLFPLQSLSSSRLAGELINAESMVSLDPSRMSFES